MNKVILVCFFFIAVTFSAMGQDSPVKVTRDTLFIEKQDTLRVQSYAQRYNPRKSLLYAAVLPGLGQIYNKKYWKLPLVYGGFYLIGNGMKYYNDIYTKYKAHLFENLENNGSADSYLNPDVRLTTGQLRRIVDRARRERDLMVVFMAGMYILQMVDAHVDTHLKEFDLNPNLRVSVEPTLQQDALTGRQTGMSVIFRF
jgi:hypothetical protein